MTAQAGFAAKQHNPSPGARTRERERDRLDAASKTNEKASVFFTFLVPETHHENCKHGKKTIGCGEENGNSQASG
jgi:hypothetical protein